MKNFKNNFILGLSLVLISTSVLRSQEEETEEKPTFNFSGAVDTYFRSSFSENPVAPATSFGDRKSVV